MNYKQIIWELKMGESVCVSITKWTARVYGYNNGISVDCREVVINDMCTGEFVMNWTMVTRIEKREYNRKEEVMNLDEVACCSEEWTTCSNCPEEDKQEAVDKITIDKPKKKGFFKSLLGL